MARDAFISHASADAPLAMTICAGLESRGLRCWIAPRDVQADGTYGTEIVKGLREASVFLIVVTDAAADSQQVEREAERASHYKKRIIPITAGRSEPGPRLEFYIAGRQYLPCPATPDARFLDGLADAIRGETVAHEPVVAEPRAKPAWLPIAAIAALVLVAVAGYWMATSLSSPTAPGPSSTPPGPSSGAGPSQTPAGPVQPPAAATGGRETRAANPPVGQPSDTTRAGVAPVVKASNEHAAPSPPRDAGRGTDPAPAGKPSPTVATIDGLKLQFVNIPPGSFRMGCVDSDSACEDDEKPAKTVTVGAFQMSQTEVTQDVWQAVMDSNRSDFPGSKRPVQNITWKEAHDFVERLTNRGDGFEYRLPTEAEWEYAARGREGAAADPRSVAIFGMTTEGPQRVGSKPANAFGLYDMLGNVAEWCQDWYAPNNHRVIRGGSWMDSSVRPTARGKAIPGTRDNYIGIRVVRTAK